MVEDNTFVSRLGAKKSNFPKIVNARALLECFRIGHNFNTPKVHTLRTVTRPQELWHGSYGS